MDGQIDGGKMAKRGRRHAAGVVLALLCLGAPLLAQDSIGGFDINEVNRQAFGEVAVDTGDDGATAARGVAPASAQGGYAVVIARTIGYLVLIIAVVVGLLWLLRKMGVTGTSRIGGGSMDLLEVLPIGQNRGILLVRVMDSVFVLAQTVQQVTLLERIDGTRAVELIASTKGGTSIVQFKDMFSSFVNRMKKS